MSISITINNINDLTDTERAVLRFVSDRSTANSLKQVVRGMVDDNSPSELDVDHPSYVGHKVPVLSLQEIAQAFSVPLTKPSSVTITPLGEEPHQVPVAPAPAPAPARAELDSAGLPWDKRIHASTRVKVADGTWRYMRGVDKALVEQVEAELRAVQAIPVPIPAPATYVGDGTGWHGVGELVTPGVNADPSVVPPKGCHPDPVAAPTVWPFATHGSPELDADAAKLEALAGVGAAGPTVADVTAPTVPLPPVPAATTPMTFAQLMQYITPLLVSGKLTQPILQGVVEKLGIPHLAYLGGRPDLVETVKAKIDEVSQ